MLTGPAPAACAASQKAGHESAATSDLYEVNEAFAAVVLRFQRELGVPDERLNVNGGAIAMGHPLGATGAMLVGTALDELERRGERRALITLCVGGGMGVTQRSSSALSDGATRSAQSRIQGRRRANRTGRRTRARALAPTRRTDPPAAGG